MSSLHTVMYVCVGGGRGGMEGDYTKYLMSYVAVLESQLEHTPGLLKLQL